MDDVASSSGNVILLSSDEEMFEVIPFSPMCEEECVESISSSMLGSLSVEVALARGGFVVSSEKLDEV